MEEDPKKLARYIGQSILSIANESERAAIIAGVAFVDDTLTECLMKLLKPVSKNQEKLFGPEKALGTLSAKIQIGYRIGFLEEKLFKALDYLRKIRNDFAHIAVNVKLSDEKYKHRVNYLQEVCSINLLWPQLYSALVQHTKEERLAIVTASIAISCLSLKAGLTKNSIIKPLNIASYRWIIPNNS